MLGILGAVSQFERQIILERQAEGIAKAKERGVYKNAKRKADHTKVRNMVAEGIPKAKIARQLGLSRQTIYDILNNTSD
jgi:DNA invertase Pin-like site-specific DNA recombinase